MKYSLLVTALLVIVGIGAYLWLTNMEPSHNRDWIDSYARTPGATVGTSSVTLHNVRDWNHSTTRVLDRTWHEDVVVPVDDVQAVWFGLSRFGSIDAVGHSYLSFELQDGRTYMLSIEARREQGETYGATKGLFNQFELWYGWGTERDFLSAALFLLDRPLEYYRLDLTTEEAQAVFVAVAGETAAIADEPAFYNTLTANCTNLLAKAINKEHEGRLPYHPSWNLPGLSVTYLQQQNLVMSTTSTTALRTLATVDATDTMLLDTIIETPEAFSLRLRQQLAE